MSDLEEVLTRLRASLKKRGAEGIRGLGIHFRICDRNRNGQLDREEFEKCVKLNRLDLQPGDRELLFTCFDKDGSGEIGYEEFLRELRGRLSPVRRQLVRRVFDVLDRMGGSKGYLTIDSIRDVYSASKHPKVMSGQMTKQEALQQFLDTFEGSKGNRDGQVTLQEWTAYYEEVSASIDLDDYFGTMMVNTWSHLKKKNPDGSRAPAITFVPAADITRLELALKRSIYEKSVSCDQKLVLERAFKQMDRDNSGSVSMPEFVLAMEKFGMQVQSAGEKGVAPGGWSHDLVSALFNRFDEDGSGALSYKEFSSQLYAGEEQPLKLQSQHPSGGLRNCETGRLIGKPCFRGNEWLKGSNHIFDMNYRG